MGTPNESDGLVNMSIESESPEGGETLHVHLRKTRLHADDANRLKNGADASNVSNRAEMACISSGDEVDTYLGAGDTKHVVNMTDGVGNQTNASSGHKDVSSIQTDANKPANTPDLSVHHKRGRNHQTYLLEAQKGPKTSQMGAGSAWMGQTYAQTGKPFETRCEWL